MSREQFIELFELESLYNLSEVQRSRNQRALEVLRNVRVLSIPQLPYYTLQHMINRIVAIYYEWFCDQDYLTRIAGGATIFEMMEERVQNEHETRLHLSNLPPAPPLLRRERRLSLQNIEEIDLLSQDSPRSSESGSAGSLHEFIVDDSE